MLTLGIVVALRDAFTPVAGKIQNSYGSLMDHLFGYTNQAGDKIQGVANKIGNSMYSVWTGMSLLMHGAAALAPILFPTEAAAKFEHQMSMIRTVWTPGEDLHRATNAEMKSLSDDIMKISLTLGADAKEMGRGAYNIVQANVHNQEDIKSMLTLSQKIVAADPLTNLADTTHGLVSIKNAFSLNTQQMEESANNLFQALSSGQMIFSEFNESLGKTIEMVRVASGDRGLNQPTQVLREFYSGIAAWTLSGGTASEGMTGMRAAMAKVAQRRNKKTMEDIETMRSQGMLPSNFQWSVGWANKTEIEGGAGGLQKFFQIVEEGAKKLAAAKGTGVFDELRRLFNSSEAASYVMATTGDQKFQLYNNILEEMTKRGDFLEQAYKIAMDSPVRQWEALQNTFKNFQIVLGEPLMNPLSLALKGFRELLINMTLLIHDCPYLTYVIAALSAAVSTLFLAIGSLLIIGGVTRMIKEAYAVSSIAFNAIGSGLASIGRGLWVYAPAIAVIIILMFTLYQAWKNNWGNMRTDLQATWEKIKLVGGAISELIRSQNGANGWMSTATFKELKAAGLLEFVVTLYMIIRRLQYAWEGFSNGLQIGFKAFMGIMYVVFRVMWPIVELLGLLVQKTLEFIGLAKSFQVSGNWKSFSNILGTIAGFLFPIWAIFVGIGKAGAILKSIFSTLFSPLLLMGRYIARMSGGFGKLISLAAKFGGTLWGWFIRLGIMALTFIATFLGVPVLVAAAIVVAIGLVIAAIVYFWDEIKAGVITAINWMKQAWMTFVNFIKHPVDTVINANVNSSVGSVNATNGTGFDFQSSLTPHMATGGEVLNGMGLAFLDPHEVVVNSPTLSKLEYFLDNSSGGKSYMRESLASKNSEPSNDDSSSNAMIAQLQQMLFALQNIGSRPIKAIIPVILDGKKIAEAVYNDMEEKQAKSY